MNQTVHVLDHVELPETAAESWVRRWRSEYLPGAQARGLRQVGLWRSHHGTASVSIDILWELPGPYAFYAMRGAAAADPSVARFWSDTDALASARDRRVLEPTGELP